MKPEWQWMNDGKHTPNGKECLLCGMIFAEKEFDLCKDCGEVTA